MSSRRGRVLEFRVEDVNAVTEAMDRIAAAHDGWVNLRPAVPDEDVPARPGGLAMLFSTEVHDVPVCTWVAGKQNRHGVEPDSLGVQHSAGIRTLAQLIGLGVELPSGWRVVQDHPRRGLVVLAPAGTTRTIELSWLLQAGTMLSKVRLNGDWIAELHGAA